MPHCNSHFLSESVSLCPTRCYYPVQKASNDNTVIAFYHANWRQNGVRTRTPVFLASCTYYPAFFRLITHILLKRCLHGKQNSSRRFFTHRHDGIRSTISGIKMCSLMNFNFRRCDCFGSNEPSVCALCIRNVLSWYEVQTQYTPEVNALLKFVAISRSVLGWIVVCILQKYWRQVATVM